MSTRTTNGSARASLFLLILLSCLGVSQAYRASAPSAGLDFYQFWAAGRAVAHSDVRDLYSEQGRQHLGMVSLAQAARSSSNLQLKVAKERQIFETTATPFLYSIFGALSSSNYETSLRAHRMLLLGCFALSILAISKLLKLGANNALSAIGILALWSEPLASDLRVGNVSCIQLAGIVLYAYLHETTPRRFRFVISGLWLGLLLAFKPNLVLLGGIVVLHGLLSRDWRGAVEESVAMLAGVTSAALVSTLAFGKWSIWLEWLEAVRRVPSANISPEMGNFAPQVLLNRQFGTKIEGMSTLLLLLVFILGAVIQHKLLRHSGRPDEVRSQAPMVLLIAYGSLASLLVPHLAWLHYFVLAIPGLLVLVSRLGNPTAVSRIPWRWMLPALAWFGLAINPFVVLGIRFTYFEYGVMTTAASLLLVALLVTPNHSEAS